MSIVENASAQTLRPDRFTLDNPPEVESIELDGSGVAVAAPASRGSDLHIVLQATATGAPLAFADALAVILATSLAALLGGTGDQLAWFPVALFLAGCFVLICGFLGLYPGAGMHPVVELRQSSMAAVLLIVAPLTAALMLPQGEPYRLMLLVTGGLTLATAPLFRTVARQLLGRVDWWGYPVLIIGGGRVGERTYRYLKTRRSLGFRPLGIVDDLHRHWRRDGSESAPYLGTLEEAPQIVRRHRVYWAVVAMSDRSPDEAQTLVQSHASCIPHLLVIPDMAGLPSLLSRSCECAGAVGIEIRSSLLLPTPRLVKRVIDVVAVLVGGLLILPLLLGISLLVKLTSPGPVLYRQQRVGRDGRRFYAWKFRTMVVDAEEALQRYLANNPSAQEEWRETQKLRHDPRVTSIGVWMRKTSLDELPQLWNVLRGEMSLVGPRPIVDEEIAKYDATFHSYMRVRPGITGLWQVSGRNDTTYAERVELDRYYVSNWSPWLDLYILARTVRVVLRREGAY